MSVYLCADIYRGYFYQILGKAFAEVYANQKIEIEKSCRCGNGRLDAGEMCDPSLPSDPNSSFRCTAFCSGMIVDPAHPRDPGLQGDLPDSGPRTVDVSGPENPVTPNATQEIDPENPGFGKLGRSSTVGGCTITLAGPTSAALSHAALLIPLIVFGMIRKRKETIR